MGHLEGNFTPVLYIGRKVPFLKVNQDLCACALSTLRRMILRTRTTEIWSERILQMSIIVQYVLKWSENGIIALSRSSRNVLFQS